MASNNCTYSYIEPNFRAWFWLQVTFRARTSLPAYNCVIDRDFFHSAPVASQYKYHTVLSLHAKTIVTCVRIF